MRLCDFPLPQLSLKIGAAALAFASSAAAAQAPTGVPCQSVAVLAVWASPEAPLTVSVNGAPVGTYDGSISTPLDAFLKPGINSIGFSYPAVPRASTEAALKCQPPGASSKTTILSFRPSAAKLQAHMDVDFKRR